MNRAAACESIVGAIGDRRLIWLGFGGEDARALTVLPQFAHCYSLHSPLVADGVEALAVESFTALRGADVDILSFLSERGRPLVDAFQDAVSRPSLLMTHTSFEFTPLLLASGETLHIGNSYAIFRTVSDKPFVEKALSGHPDFSTIPWRPLPNGPERRAILLDELRSGPLVLRSSSHGGGVGHELIRDATALSTSVTARAEGTVHIAPYLQGYVPVCIGACVFPDGTVTVHTPSLQLIGIRECRPLDFGYCGNDFGAASGLGRLALDRLESCTRVAGEWLHSMEFIGAFGLDALVYGDDVVFVEINARFLGSSRLSAEADARMDLPDVYLDHLMACLGLPSHASPSLAVQAVSQPALSHILCFNREAEPVALSPAGMDLPAGFGAALLAAAPVRVAAGALLFELCAERTVTEDGRNLTTEAASAVTAGLAAFSHDALPR